MIRPERIDRNQDDRSASGRFAAVTGEEEKDPCKLAVHSGSEHKQKGAAEAAPFRC
jgi:hypothetical protein